MNDFKTMENIDVDTVYSLTYVIGNQLAAEMINSQTILQILVQKGVCTPDEVKEMRDKVERCSKSIKAFKVILEAVNEKYSRNVEENELLFKLFSGKCTPEEEEKAKKIANNIFKPRNK